MDKDKYFAMTGAVVVVVALICATLVGLKREDTKSAYDIGPRTPRSHNTDWNIDANRPRNIYLDGATLTHVTNDLYRYTETTNSSKVKP